MKKFFQSKGFIVSSLALLCVTILGVCWFVSRDRTGDFRPDESPPSSVTGDWSDGGTQTDGDNGADAYAPGQSTDAEEEYPKVGGYNLPSNIAHQLSDVNGLYATADLAVGDYILTSKISSVPVSSDVALNSIPSGKVAISLTVKTLASGLSDKLQPGDIIRIYHFLDTAAEVPELRFVKVLSVTDSDGINVDNAKEPTEDEEKQQSATITVLASPEQAKIITGLENDGVAHVALISRNNDKLADELLAEQDKTLQEIYFPETLIEEEAADAENSDVESEPQETETAESAQSTNETAPSAE